jgi:hypothetical protein
MTLNFSTASVSGGASQSFYLDLSQVASLVNRRFYRQGINWAVSGIKISTNGDGSLTTMKLPNTWVMGNAWEKSFRSWQEMNEKALEDTESIRPRFMDFKIFADARHHNLGYGANLLPNTLKVTNAGVATIDVATAGEWESSKISIPTSGATGNATDFEVIAVGASFPGAGASTLDAVSAIEGYASSRGLPYSSDPNVPDDADDVGPTGTPENWMGALTNEAMDQDKDVLDRMVGAAAENNQAPYPFENDGVNADTMYPNGANQLDGMEIHDFQFITPTTVGGTTRIHGGMFPCGLMCFFWAPNTSSNLNIQLELVPGHHRGYLCEPMTDM